MRLRERVRVRVGIWTLMRSKQSEKPDEPVKSVYFWLTKKVGRQKTEFLSDKLFILMNEKVEGAPSYQTSRRRKHLQRRIC